MKYQNFIKKTFGALALSIVFGFFSVNAAIFITPKAPVIAADAYVVMDYQSGEVIASNNMHKKHAPASLTKLMTAYVVFQLIKDGRISLEDDVKISKKAWKTGGSKSFIEVGKSIKLKTLLKGMIIQSGNDAAVALAEHIAGTEGTFTAYMNEYARELGMKNTRFENSSGLDFKDQHTTAYDIALLSEATIKQFPDLYKWYKEKTFTYHGIKQHNRNKLLWSDSTVDGLKTGFTAKAKYNLAASAKRMDDMRLISVVLGSGSAEARSSQTQKILDYGFRFFESKSIKDFSKQIPVSSSTKDSIKVGLKHHKNVLLPRGQYKLSKQVIELYDNLSAPIKTGDVIGNFVVKFEDTNLAKLPIIALEDAPEVGFFSRMLEKIGF